MNDLPKQYDWSLLSLRLGLGVVFLVHGSQKMFGWFGGKGLSLFLENWGFGGPVIGFLVAFGEFFGGLAIIVGLLSRFSSAIQILIMMGAIALVHGKNGFLMSEGGFEYNFVLISMAIATTLIGPGRFSMINYLPLPEQVKKFLA